MNKHEQAFNETVIKVPSQSIKINDFQADIQIINESENDFEMMEDSSIGHISLYEDDCVQRCNKVLVNLPDDIKGGKKAIRFCRAVFFPHD